MLTEHMFPVLPLDGTVTLALPESCHLYQPSIPFEHTHTHTHIHTHTHNHHHRQPTHTHTTTRTHTNTHTHTHTLICTHPHTHTHTHTHTHGLLGEGAERGSEGGQIDGDK